MSQYRATKERLAAQPKGKQFDFNETAIFGQFDLLCKRVQKLLDMFTTTMQFSSLSLHRVEGLEVARPLCFLSARHPCHPEVGQVLIQRFCDIMVEFKRMAYGLLVFLQIW